MTLTVYRLLKKGQFHGFKIGSDWRFNREAIDTWRMQAGATLDELPGRKAANIR
jgi:excisionase family DNA binding protein